MTQTEDGEKALSLFPKAQGDILECLLLSRPTVNKSKICEEIFTFEKLESENCKIVVLKNDSK